jgi:hypothetical protein
MFITDAMMIDCINTTLSLNLTGAEFVFLFYVMTLILKNNTQNTCKLFKLSMFLCKKIDFTPYISAPFLHDMVITQVSHKLARLNRMFHSTGLLQQH